MHATIDLSPEHLAIVERILAEHAPGCEVRAFGSRATWTAKEYSDLDLAVVGAEPLPPTTRARLKEAFEESRLPMRVDVLDWHSISERFQQEIEREYVVLRPETRPAEWRDTTFGECAVLVRDNVSPADCGDEPYIGLEHIREGTLTLLGHGSARDVISTKSRFQASDILFGKLRPYFRKVIRPQFSGICSTDIWVIRPSQDVDAGYLFYFMASQDFVDVATQGAEGTRMPRAKWDYVSQIELSLPPIEEQRRIARILGALDDKIELNRRMCETLDEMARVLFKSWFVDFEPVRAKMEGRWQEGESLPGLPAHLYDLFPNRLTPSELGDIPEGWEVRALGDVSGCIRGRSYRSTELADSDIALVTLKSFLRGGGYRPEGLKPYTGKYKPEQVVKPGEMIIACTDVTQSAEVVGRPATVQADPRFSHLIASLDTLILRPSADCPIPLTFLYELARTPRFTDHTYAHVSGTTVLHLKKDSVPAFRFPAPPSAVVDVFNHLATTVRGRVTNAHIESSRISALRDALLLKLVSGELQKQETRFTHS